MQKDWYVVANEQEGSMVRLRIVAGPLTREAATEEAQLRLKRLANNIHLAVVEFDSLYGLSQ